ncbi:hypothetical protein D9M70_586850 [compost metagenome]
MAKEFCRCRLRVRPYGWPKPCVAATTSDAESVRAMKPMFSALFSGASEPATQARLSGRLCMLSLIPTSETKRHRSARSAMAAGEGDAVVCRGPPLGP